MKIIKLLALLMLLNTTACSMVEKVESDDTDKTLKSDIIIGVQLWSVHDKLKQDFTGTIEAIADMGFEAVEFAGIFGEYVGKPVELKNYLKSKGLVISGAHVGFDVLTDDKIEQTLEFYKKLGANYLIIPWDERAWHSKKIYSFMADLNRLFPIIKKAGFEFGFHNHDQEFNSFEHHTYWDHIAISSNPDMILQLDVGWTNYAGKDPIHYVKAYKGRTLTTHFKIRTHKGEDKSPILSEDDYDWAKLFAVMQEFGGTKWVIVEQEEYPEGLTSLQSVEKSKDGLLRLLKIAN